jgi:hypothetical protein
MKIFKNILVGMLAVAFIGTAISYKNEVVAASTDWEISDHNWDVNWEQSGYDIGVNVRNQYRSDYDHAELSIKLRPMFLTPFTVAVRIAEEDGAREYRPTLTQSVINWDMLKDEEGNEGPISLSLGHRIEYRHYEGINAPPSNWYSDGVDANWRYRGIITVGLNVLDNINIWARVQPRFEFGEGKENDFEIDDVKNQVGFSINLGDNATFSPYVEYLMDGQDNNFERKEVMVGTRLAFKLN